MQSLIPRPHAPYFMVQSSRQKERDSKDKIGDIFIASSQTFMLYNLQQSPIVGIGERAKSYFPEAKVGDTLIYHHFVQGNNETDAKENHLVHQDEDFNYYVVSATEVPGKDIEAYGVFNGETIIPNKDYVFLETKKPIVEDLPNDDRINQSLKKTESGLFLFNEWKETREEKEDRLSRLKMETQELSKSGNHKQHVQQGILEREREMNEISAQINSSKYQPFTVAYANPLLSEWFDRPIMKGDVLGMLNVACHTTVKFNGEEYIVAKTKYIAYLYDK